MLRCICGSVHFYIYIEQYMNTQPQVRFGHFIPQKIPLYPYPLSALFECLIIHTEPVKKQILPSFVFSDLNLKHCNNKVQFAASKVLSVLEIEHNWVKMPF